MRALSRATKNVDHWRNFYSKECSSEADAIKEKVKELDTKWDEVKDANEVHTELLQKSAEIAEFKQNFDEISGRIDTLKNDVSKKF